MLFLYLPNSEESGYKLIMQNTEFLLILYGYPPFKVLQIKSMVADKPDHHLIIKTFKLVHKPEISKRFHKSKFCMVKKF